MIQKEDLELLAQKMDDGVLADKLKNDLAWQLIERLSFEVAERTKVILSNIGMEVAIKGEISVENRMKIAIAKTKMEFYGNFILNITKNLYDEGKNAFDLAKSTGDLPETNHR